MMAKLVGLNEFSMACRLHRRDSSLHKCPLQEVIPLLAMYVEDSNPIACHACRRQQTHMLTWRAAQHTQSTAVKCVSEVIMLEHMCI